MWAGRGVPSKREWEGGWERGKKGGWRETGRTGQRRKKRDGGTSSGQKRKKAIP